VSPDGNVSGNLIIAICVTCEKKIVVPVQLCVLSTGFVQVASQQNAVCTTFPALFPNQIKPSDTLENCGIIQNNEDDECCTVHDDCCDNCGPCDTCRPQRPPRPQPRR